MNYFDLPKDKTFLISAKGLILDEQGRLLLLKMGDKDPHKGNHWKWDIPGGLIEIDEDVRQALTREIKEECGLEVGIGKLMATNDVLVEGFKFKNGDIKDARIFVLGFFCKYLGGIIKLSEEHEEYEWINVDNISDWDIIPNARGLIEKAFNQPATSSK